MSVIQGLSPKEQRAQQRLERLAWFMDSAIRVPVLGRIGLDGIIGIVPVVGDIVGVIISGYILLEGARLGTPKAKLARMAGNVGLEALVGAVPVVGDLFDIVFKANQRNVDILREYLETKQETEQASKFFGYILIGLAVAAAVGLVWLGYVLATTVFGDLFS